MMNYKFIGSQYILNVLNEDNICMIVRSVPLYEIKGEEGIRVTSQIIYTHINSYDRLLLVQPAKCLQNGDHA